MTAILPLMVNQTVKSRKTKRVSPPVSGLSQKDNARPKLAEQAELAHAIAAQVVVFVVAFLIVVSRRPGAVLNAQFFAEDGVAWFLDAYNLGLRCLVVPQGSYMHMLARFIALLS